MHFPKYWTRVYDSSRSFCAKGWSDISLDQAVENAEARLQRIVAWWQNPEDVSLEDSYSYEIDGVICEEVIEKFSMTGQSDDVIISRNAYGALVLNAAKVMFLDFDFRPFRERAKPNWWEWFQGRRTPTDEQLQALVIDRIRHWTVKEDSGLTIRIYRTAGGIRAIVTNKLHDRVGQKEIALMNGLQVDPLYRKLCVSQQCFRARLTPKPWRIRAKRPPHLFVNAFDDTPSRNKSWLAEYEMKSQKYSVCRYVETIGVSPTIPIVESVIRMHDVYCCKVGKPLA